MPANDGYGDEQIKYLFDVTKVLRSEWDSYHNHKENITHAIFLLEVAIFGALFSVALPPEWYIQSQAKVTRPWSDCLTWLPLLFAPFIFVPHWFLLWQFRMKRLSNDWTDKMLEALVQWTQQPPKKDQLARSQPIEPNDVSGLKRFVAYFIFPQESVIPEGTATGTMARLPICLDEFFWSTKKGKRQRQPPPVVWSERTISAGSLFLCVSSAIIFLVRWYALNPK